MSPALAQTLPVLSLVVVGFVLKQIGAFRNGDGQVLARLIINITLPAVIFLSVAHADVPPARWVVLAFCGMAIPLLLQLVAGGVVLRLRWPRRTAGVVLLGTMATNIGFFLYPLFGALYGPAGTSQLAAFDIGNSLVCNSLGLYVAIRYGDAHAADVRQGIRRVLTSPVLLAVAFGLVVNLTGLEIPPAVLRPVELVSQANTPLAMLTLGSFLQVRYARWAPLVVSVALRMGVGFLIGQLLVLLFGLSGMERVTVAIGAAMPVGLVTLVYSVSEGLDAEVAAGAISLSILVGMVITPLLLTAFS